MIGSITLETGTLAPEFRLKSTPDQRVGLSDFRGRPVVLVFYQADFNPICSDEMKQFNDAYAEFQKYDAQVLGISADNVWSHLAFSAQHKLRFPLLSDFQPKGAVSKKYLAYMADDGHSARALYVIDRDGVIAWAHLTSAGVNPGHEAVLKALASLDDGRLKKKGAQQLRKVG